MTAADDTPQWRARQTNPLAIASIVCGMAALVLGPLAIPAIVFGHVARGQIRRTGEGGYGIGTAGLILGYVVLVVGTALLVAFLASLPNWRRGAMSGRNAACPVHPSLKARQGHGSGHGSS
jgi:hypothetical protein